MSFRLTVDQFLNGTKSVTRRLGWSHVDFSKHDTLTAVYKGQGLMGDPLTIMGQAKFLDFRREPLEAIIDEPDGTAREGFPDMTPEDFVTMFSNNMGCRPDVELSRIEFVPVVNPKFLIEQFERGRWLLATETQLWNLVTKISATVLPFEPWEARLLKQKDG